MPRCLQQCVSHSKNAVFRSIPRPSVTQVQLTDTGVRCTLNNTGGEYSEDVERVLLAVGVQPNIEDLGLETLGVELDRGFIKTDAACRTNVFGLYAIGDVAGPPCLAHKASHEGVLCVETLGRCRRRPPSRSRLCAWLHLCPAPGCQSGPDGIDGPARDGPSGSVSSLIRAMVRRWPAARQRVL